MTKSGTIIVAGAGQAGGQAAVSLRQEKFEGRIILIGDEPALPYQRPPLSKAYLSGKMEAEGLLLRAAKVYADQNIELMTHERIDAIDPGQRTVRLASGTSLGYEHLVLAVGSRNRALPVPGADLEGVAYLRTLEEAQALRHRLGSAENVVVIGGGFIGLEFAAVAREHGQDVRVIEAAPRLMGRAVSNEISQFLLEKHVAHGTHVTLNRCATRLIGEDGHVAQVELDNGDRLPADLVVVGIGVVPNVELAQAAGLAVANGIVVDQTLATGDPAISAIGDCAAFPSPFADGMIRLESVQNAVDQARFVAARIMGKQAAYASVPWFWSDQHDAKLQIAGLTMGYDQAVIRGHQEANSFSMFCFRQGRLLGAESINDPVDHMAVRKLLAAKAPLSPAQAADPAFELKKYAGSVGK